METLFSCRRTAALLSTLFILSGLLGGCASSRLLKNPKPPTVADVGWAATAPEGLTVEVHELIFRNSGGTWVRNANWDEYVLTITNSSAGAIEIQEIDLYSDRLPAPEASSTSRAQLDARSNRTLRAMKDAGIVAGVGIVGPSALIVAGVGTSGGMLSASGAGAAAATVGHLRDTCRSHRRHLLRHQPPPPGQEGQDTAGSPSHGARLRRAAASRCAISNDQERLFPHYPIAVAPRAQLFHRRRASPGRA